MSNDSDIESVISEEDIAVGYGSDDSAYDPNAAEYDPSPINPSKPEPLNTMARAPPSSNTRSAPPIQIATKPTKLDDYSMEYSVNFEDEEERSAILNNRSTAIAALDNDDYSNNYSNDFDSDFEPDESAAAATSAASTTVGSTTRGAAAGKAVTHSSNKTGGSVSAERVRTSSQAESSATVPLPSLSIQSLQAELAIDEISKEVVRLRNKQKALLRERQAMAKEKKMRAEQRRQQYLRQMSEYENKLQIANDEIEALKRQTQLLQSQHQSIANSKDMIEQTLHSEQQLNAELSKSIDSLKVSLLERESEITALTRKLSVLQEEKASEARKLWEKVSKAELLASVLQRSTEATEERVKRERDQLPAYHQHVLDEELQRIRLLEASLVEREGLFKAEEARRLTALDKLRAETVVEADRLRQSIFTEVNFVREDVESKKTLLDQEKAAFSSQMVLELAAMDSRKMELIRMQKSIDEERTKLLRERTELEVRQKMLEPNLVSSERDREEALVIRSRAQLELSKVEEKINAVFEADRNLVLREADLEKGWAVIQESRAELMQIQESIDADRAIIEAQMQKLESERFQLHIAATEMREQVGEMQSSMQLLMKSRVDSHGMNFSISHRLQENRPHYLNNSMEIAAPPSAAQLRDGSNSPSLLLDPALQKAVMSLHRVSQALESTATSLVPVNASPMPLTLTQGLGSASRSAAGSTSSPLYPPVPPTSIPGQPGTRRAYAPSPVLNTVPNLLQHRDFDSFLTNSATRKPTASDIYSSGHSIGAGEDFVSVLTLQHSLDNTDALAASLKDALKRFS